MRISVKINGDFSGLAGDVGRQIRFAAALALTKTGQIVKEDLRNEMQRVFDRPTPYTLNSLQLRPATKGNLEAEVSLKEFGGTPAWKYLGPQIEGGDRAAKRFEKSLRHVGLLPSGMFATPGPAADFDRYGNMNRGQIVKILSALRASSDATQNRGKDRGRGTRRLEEYFVGGFGRSAHLKPGIYRRFPNRTIKMVIRYVRSPAYRVRFDFYGMAERSISENFDTQFAKALDYALATAR
jgi:hypothetical protein